MNVKAYNRRQLLALRTRVFRELCGQHRFDFEGVAGAQIIAVRAIGDARKPSESFRILTRLIDKQA